MQSDMQTIAGKLGYTDYRAPSARLNEKKNQIPDSEGAGALPSEG